MVACFVLDWGLFIVSFLYYEGRASIADSGFLLSFFFFFTFILYLLKIE